MGIISRIKARREAKRRRQKVFYVGKILK